MRMIFPKVLSEVLSLVRAGGALALGCLAAMPAAAHPHVWVSFKSAVVYETDGRIAGIRHAWSFDKAYSAYATQGLDKNGDGKLSEDELAELVKINMESLNEYAYFTVAKANGAKLEFAAPKDYRGEFADGLMTLHFFLPLKTPARLDKAAFMLEVYDPTYFVDFGVADGDDAMQLVNAPKGCKLDMKRPAPAQAAPQQNLSESFFSALTSSPGYGSQFANKAIVVCP